MKKLFRISAAIVAALVSLAACQKADEVENQAPKLTHTVKFTTDLPTKTSYEIDRSTVNYKWEDSDLKRLHVYEDGVEGTIIDGESTITESYVELSVVFEGTGEGAHTYTANLNEGIIKSNQVADGKYDSDCDVLVAKPVSSDEIVEDYYTFRFRRPVAITELKLKNLKAEEKVSKVTIVSDAVHPLVGTYTQSETDAADGTWGEKSNKIVVTFGTEQDGETPKTKTVESDGSLIVSIVSMPVENASVKVLVETENGLKYRKVTSAALTLTANNVKSQGIGLTQVTEAEHAEDGWYLVTDANELFDGDEIRIACTSENVMAGDFVVTEKGTQVYLANRTVSFDDNKLTGITPGSEPQIFTLSEGYDKWNILSPNGDVLCAANAEGLKYNDGEADWSISIDNTGVSTVSSATQTFGSLKYNKNNPRFRNYTSSQTSIQIYKKYGDASDPIIKKARTASFSPEAATVTIDANDNVFPELSFEPAGATEGTRTWTSSNTEVATVDNEGNVTLLTDGTTTISVEIAATDTYQPCNASYELTVNPAAVEGVDYLDRNFTGISDGATTYADWSGKVGSSGNTYAGNSAGSNNAIQLRSDKNTAGIVVTNSASNQVARKVTVDWESHTSNGRTLDIYGKSTAYTAASDLYSNDTQGTKLGSIVNGTSTELTITGDYEYIGIRSNSSAHYLNWIKIQWEDAKPGYEACFKDAGGNTVTEVNAIVGSVFTVPTLYKGATPSFADAYESSNTDVATVDAQGAITLKKKGDAIITATLEGDETHKTTKVSYTLHVANKLSSIKLADDSEQPTTFYVGQDFSFSGIKIEAEYNDGEKKTLTADDLDAENFSGFDSSAAVESQTITVSYTDGATKTTTYNVEIKPLVTLYGITVPAEDANGNSITVKGGLTEAPEGGEIELNVNLNTEKGYKLTSLKVNEVEHSADVAEGKYTFTMPAEAVTVTAEFDNHYTVTLGSATNGSFTVNDESTGPVSIVYGTAVNLEATPSTGYVFKTWTVDGATVASATAATTSFTMPANDVTVNAEFELKSVKPGTYSIATNNSLWGTNYNGTATGCTTVSGSQNDISITLNKADCGNAMYINNSQTRAYSGNTMVFSVPEGYVITAIAFTADGSNWGGEHTASSGEMTDNKNWKGSANSVTINFKGSCRIVSVSVTYYKAGEVPAVDASWSVNPSSVSVKAGENKTATITTDYNGTLSVTSNDTGIATATISGKTITVTGVKEGTTTLTVTGAATTAFNAIDKTINVTVTAAGSVAKTYTAEILSSTLKINDSSQSSTYAKYKGAQSVVAKAADNSEITMNFEISDVMPNGKSIQFRASSGSLTGADWGTIKSIDAGNSDLSVNYDGGSFSVKKTNSGAASTAKITIVFTY